MDGLIAILSRLVVKQSREEYSFLIMLFVRTLSVVLMLAVVITHSACVCASVSALDNSSDTSGLVDSHSHHKSESVSSDDTHHCDPIECLDCSDQSFVTATAESVATLTETSKLDANDDIQWMALPDVPAIYPERPNARAKPPPSEVRWLADTPVSRRDLLLE